MFFHLLITLGCFWHTLAGSLPSEGSPVLLACDAENLSQCDLEQGAGDFNWQRNLGFTPSQNTGPSQDHTTGSGYYFYTEASDQRSSSSAYLRSATATSATGTICVNMAYHMYGEEMGDLRLYISTGVTSFESKQLFWSKSGNQGDAWKTLKVTQQLEGGRNFRIFIEGRIGNSVLSDIAIDDFKVTDGFCSDALLLCNFDSSSEETCSLTQSAEDRFNWVRHSGPTMSAKTGPFFDHTTATTNRLGYFMYIEASSEQDGYNAVLESARFKGTSPYMCLTFYYHMHGQDMGTLNVYHTSGDATRKVWTMSGPQGDQWLEANTVLQTFESGASSKLMFEAIRGSTYLSDIAIDDIEVVDKICPGLPVPTGRPVFTTPARQQLLVDCSFEMSTNQMCSVEQIRDGSDNLDWTRYSGATLSLDTGPSYDHTTKDGNKLGYFMYLEASNENAGDKAHLLIKPLQGISVGKCLKFYYHMYGDDIGSLNVYQVEKFRVDLSQANEIWSKQGNQGDVWREAILTLNWPLNRETVLVFEAIRGNGYLSDIAIDDVTLLDQPCSVTPTSLPTPNPSDYLYGCTFEDVDRKCVIIQDTSDNFNWFEHSGSTNSGGTGPTSDHTTINTEDKTGNYMYIEASDAQPGDKARIETGNIRGTRPYKCLSFWYHMFGDDMGTLNVYQYTIVGQRKAGPGLIWSLTGNQGNVWRQARLSLTDQFMEGMGTTGASTELVFEGIKGRAYESDIAIDDIFVRDGICPGSTAPTPYSRTTPVQIQDVMRCHFDTEEETTCSLTNVNLANEGNYFWQRYSGSTPSDNTGPTDDHTLKQIARRGYYMYAEASDQSVGTTARLLSSDMTGTTDKCLRFAYHMNGDGMGSLDVYMIPYLDGAIQSNTLLWRRSGNQEDMWKLAEIDVRTPGVSYTMKIAFDAVRGASFTSDIAIDDVVVTQGPCSPITRQPTLRPTPTLDPRCEEIMCLLYCAYGFEKDARGCPICKCLDPCKYVVCDMEKVCLPTVIEEPNTCPAIPKCVDPEEICKMPLVEGTCEDRIERYFYNVNNRQCELFTYKGCTGNMNNFKSRELCERVCSKMSTRRPVPKCLLPVPSNCETRITKWVYNAKVGECERHENRLCVDLPAGFDTEQECEETCFGARCLIERDPQKCMSEMGQLETRWYYNLRQRKCLSVRSTCKSYYNEFATRFLCERECAGVSMYKCNKTCDLECKFGYELDQAGCERCSCKPDPCVLVECARGEVCLHEMPPKYLHEMPPTYHRGPRDVVAYCTNPLKICKQPKVSGPCKGAFQRYYFNVLLGQCEQFIYGGCHGNENNFVSMKECETVCKDTLPLTFEHCYLPPRTGPCLEYSVNYFHNKTSGSCQPFIYGGCDGNTNRYASKELCQEKCRIAVCNMQKDHGVCRASQTRWYYDLAKKRCESFIYGGCGGNGNRFSSKLDCENRCSGVEPPICENVDCTIECPFGYIQSVLGCSLCACRNPCESLSCQEGKSCHVLDVQCVAPPCKPVPVCIEPSKLCGLPEDEGLCNEKLTRYHFNPYNKQCEAFDYTGCSGNANNFPSLESCLRFCRDIQVPTRTPPIDIARGPLTICALPKNSGKCNEYVQRWYFDVKTGQCEEFRYGGCNGNDNNFRTSEECNQKCKKAACILELNTGDELCTDRLERFYYNHEKQSCVPFIYSGCNGNANHFRTISTCREFCSGDIQPTCGLPCLKQCMYGREVDKYGCPLCGCKKNPCETNPCQRGGKCYYNDNELFCVCPLGYGGKFCEEQSTACPVTGPGPRTTPMPFSPLNCDFETECSWREVGEGGVSMYGENLVDMYDWQTYTGQTSTSGTGPNGDHTTGSGRYHYFEASDKPMGGIAKYLSPELSMSSEICLEFYAHMNGDTMGTLELLQMYYSETLRSARMDTLWKLTGNQGENWFKVRVTVPLYDKYYLAFRAIRGEGAKSDMAIDDIKILSDSGGCDALSGPVEMLNCNFENDCSWKDLQNDALYGAVYSDGFDWRKGSGTTSTPNTGPRGDHTSGNGNYLYFEATRNIPDPSQDVAKYLSPLIKPSGNICFSFWLHMKGANMGSIELRQIYRNEGNVRESILWSRTGEQGEDWLQVQVTIPYHPDYYLIFTATRGSDYLSDIAIDDLLVTQTNGACSQRPVIGNSECNFDVPQSCSWVQATETTSVYGSELRDEINWISGKGTTPSGETGPTSDHTTGEGSYLFIETSNPATQGQKAIYISPVSLSATVACLEMWYHMNGASVGSLAVYRLLKVDGSNMQKDKIWEMNGPKGTEWLKASVTLPAVLNAVYRVAIEGVVGSSYEGDIAIDDIKITSGTCEMEGKILDLVCNFEDMASCYWSNVEANKEIMGQVMTDELNWERLSGATSTLNTGPLRDHTTGNGYYIHVDASLPAQINNQALYVSVPVTGSGCLQFYYHMYGNTVGTLKLYKIYRMNNERMENVIWQLSGNQQNEWKLAKVNLEEVESMYVLVFKGIRGSGSSGDIAIDDISVTETCEQSFSFEPFRCNFEDTCNWIQVENTNLFGGQLRDNLNWQTTNTATPTGGTGPTGDHTTGSGRYMHLEASTPSRPFDRAWYLSPEIPSLDACLEFWYHMYGENLGTLSVIQIYGLSNQQNIWQGTGNYNDWRKAKIDLVSPRAQYRIIIEGVVGNGPLGDISIDDIRVSGGRCDQEPTTSPVLPMSSLNCNFEDTECKWIQGGADARAFGEVFADNIDWTYNQGRTASNDTGPDSDHTTGTGQYAYIESSIPATEGDRAYLISYLISSGNICMRFWYSMHGSSIGSLKITQLYKDGEAMQRVMRWQKLGEQGMQWKEGLVTLPVVPGNYRVLIEATVGNGHKGDIAIDDITFTEGPCPEVSGMQCNFEDECPWIQANPEVRIFGNTITDTFNWIRNRGQTSTPNTGPNGDHTLNGLGYYMHLEATTPQRPNDIATYISPQLTPSAHCFSMYYHMNGMNIGYLKVHQFYLSSSSITKMELWSRAGGQGTEWRRAEVQIPALTSGESQRILIEGIVGTSELSDIAIDDLMITPGLCAQTVILECDFDGQECGFTDSTRDTFDWLTAKTTQSVSTGPEQDHTTGTGNFMYIEASNRAEGDQAILEYNLPDQKMKCLTMWYHMWGTDIGSLEVLLTANDGSVTTSLWKKSGPQANMWKKVYIDIQETTKPHKISLVGTVGKDYLGDVAVDDIRMTTGGHCFNFYETQNCGFERSLCFFRHGTGAFQWTMHAKGMSIPNSRHPSTSHDTDGYYMYIDTSTSSVGQTAILETGNLQLQARCLSFWYYMTGTTVGTLSVHEISQSDNFLLWSRTGSQGSEWLNAVVDVGVLSNSEYKLQFKGTVAGNLGDIIIDHVTLSQGVCTR